MAAIDPLVLTFAILGVAVVLLLSDRLRADLVALLVALALGLAGVLTTRQAFSGFSSSAVITIVAVFVVTEGLRVTGLSERAGEIMERVAGTSERRQVIVVMAAGAGLAMLMNNIAAAAILLPGISGLARRHNVGLGRLLMPLAFSTLLGGMATLFTSANIIVSGVLRVQDFPGYGVLDFLPLGIPIILVGILYMALWGRRMLPAPSPLTTAERERAEQPELIEIYQLGERLFRARVLPDSPLAGKSLAQSDLRQAGGVNVVGLDRGGRLTAAPAPDEVLGAGDIVFLEGKIDEFRQQPVAAWLDLLPETDWREAHLASETVVIVEAVLAPRSTLLGQTLRAARFRDKYGMNVVGVWRGGRPIRTNLGDLPLEFGDALLLQGEHRRIALLRTEPDLIVLNGRDKVRPNAARHARRSLALIILLGALVLAGFNPSSVGEIMLGAALLMVLLGVLTMDQAYGAIEWRSVFLVAGMLPLGLALTESGAAAWLADKLIAVVGPAGPHAMLGGLVLLTALLAQVMNGAAVATVMAPIAIGAAQQTGMDPRALAMGVTLASSLAFLTPLGHPVNVLVMGPGGYQFRDYLKVGWPLTVLLIALILVLLPVLWPLAAG